MNLYDISKGLAEINDQLITAEGEISPELEGRLDGLQLELTEKATGLRKWLVKIDSDETALDNEIRRLEKIKTVRVNLRERLLEYIKKNMEVADKKSLPTPIGTFSICKNPPSAECIAEEATPEEYLTIIPEHFEVDKTKVKEALKSGQEVTGWKWVTDRTHLRVK